MTCPKCGAEISAGNKFCDFCGAQISLEMQKEQEQLNKAGCPKCGSTNVVFEREVKGAKQKKNETVVKHTTVGVCKDCGYTWKATTGGDLYGDMKRGAWQWIKKYWLWVLGWVYIFPLPLTILLLRKKEMKAWLKYGIIVVAWLLPLLLFVAAGTTAGSEISDLPTTSEVSSVAATSFVITPNEMGEYGFEKTLNKGTEFEETQIVYHIPAGTYAVENLGEYQGQIEACSDKTHLTDEGWEEPEETKSVLIVKPGETVEFSIENGFYLESQVNGQLKFTKK